MSLPVLTAVTGSWEAPLVAGLERDAGEVQVVRRCADLAELLAAALAGVAVAAVVSADLHRLDGEALARLADAGVAVVALAAPGDAASAERLRALGAARVVSADRPPAEIAAAVAEAVGEALSAPPRERRHPGVPALRSDPAAALAATRTSAPLLRADVGALAATTRGAPGRIVAVWGPVGSPGRTTVAITLAAELAAHDLVTLLVDADTYGPSLAQSLGLLDDGGGIAGAVRAAGQGRLDVDRLAQLSPAIGRSLRVLVGLTRASRWPELRPSGLEGLWDVARALSAWTVVDTGFALEADEEAVFDTAAPRRNAATLSALSAADEVLAVGTADPIGLHRLVRGLDELADALGPAVRPRVVVTRIRAATVGPDPGRRVAAALAKYAHVTDPVLVPDDPAALDAALLAGRMLHEVAPHSPARGAIAGLAADLIAATAP